MAVRRPDGPPPCRVVQEGEQVTRELRVLVVLPTYNEAENIGEVLDLVRHHLPEGHVLVVDDGSPDGTADLAEAWGADHGGAKVLRRPGKAGLGSAYRAGFRQGLDEGYDVLVEMDSDLQHDPAALPRLVHAVAEGAALAIGSRYVPGGQVPEWKLSRRMISQGGNIYAAVVLGLPVRDATAGYRAYAADVLRSIDLDAVKADGYGFQVEMAYQVHQRGGPIAEVPITFHDRQRGTSKMSLAIVAEALVLVTWWGLRDRVVRPVARLLRRR